MAIVIVAIGVAVLLNHVIVEVKTTIRWLCAAIFLALALNPLVDLSRAPGSAGASLPRWLAILVAYVLFFALLTFLVLAVIPPIVREVEHLGSQLPDLRQGLQALGQQQRPVPRSQPQVRHHPACSHQEASQLPSKLGDAAGARRRSRSGSSTTSSRRSSSSR